MEPGHLVMERLMRRTYVTPATVQQIIIRVTAHRLAVRIIKTVRTVEPVMLILMDSHLMIRQTHRMTASRIVRSVTMETTM
jgi:hypothetical protein